MKLHLANTDDGYMIWGVFLRGRHNDGDGGVDICHEWFVVARTQQEVRDSLDSSVEAEKCRYRFDQKTVHVEYRPISPMEMVPCLRGPGGRLNPVMLAGGSPAGFSITAALLDTRD